MTLDILVSSVVVITQCCKVDMQVEGVYFVLSSLLFVCCVALTGRKWPDEAFVPPYHLLSVRAERYMLPLLPYEMAALEPYIDRDTVVAHYEGHHEAYRRKMNAVLNDWREDVSFARAVSLRTHI